MISMYLETDVLTIKEYYYPCLLLYHVTVNQDSCIFLLKDQTLRDYPPSTHRSYKEIHFIDRNKLN